MAVSKLALTNLAATLFQDTASTATVVGVTAASTTVYEIEIDNSALASVVFTKLWNVASGSVTLGTTDPDLIVRVPASAKVTLVFPTGLVLDTAVSVATVTAGGTGGTAAPATPPTVRIAHS